MRIYRGIYYTLYSFVIFVFSALIYITYLFYDFKNQENGWREDFGLHKKREIQKVAPNALLLGGSNVAYSLSANQLTTSTEYSWYNLGLSSEAFNDQTEAQDTSSDEAYNAIDPQDVETSCNTFAKYAFWFGFKGCTLFRNTLTYRRESCVKGRGKFAAELHLSCPLVYLHVEAVLFQTEKCLQREWAP